MRLIRFEAIDVNGNKLGIAHEVRDKALDNDTIDEILYWEEYLHIPNPYPTNTKAYFTLQGLKYNKELVKLYIKRCLANGYKVNIVKTWKDKCKVIYEDNEQILIKAQK